MPAAPGRTATRRHESHNAQANTSITSRHTTVSFSRCERAILLSLHELVVDLATGEAVRRLGPAWQHGTGCTLCTCAAIAVLVSAWHGWLRERRRSRAKLRARWRQGRHWKSLLIFCPYSWWTHGPSVGTQAIQEKYNSDIPAMRCVYICVLTVKYKNSMSRS